MFRKIPIIVLLLVCTPLVAHAGKGNGDKPDESIITALEKRIIELEKDVVGLEDLLLEVSRGTDPNTGKDTITFSGMNVQVVNGLGLTTKTNGAGNLIIGYNELRATDDNFRGGSHMLVIGAFNNYTDLSYGGMSVGTKNETAAPFASVSGGVGNLAIGLASSISGGTNNLARGNYSVVSGGGSNAAEGNFASINGGVANIAEGHYSLVGGGVGNTSSGWGASVSGGTRNTASSHYSSVNGGNKNTASGFAASVSGGDDRDATASYCWEAADQTDC